MSVAVEEPEVIRSMRESLRAPPLTRPQPDVEVIDRRPLVGGEINIRSALTPGLITLLAAPVSVMVSMAVGWFLLRSIGVAVYAHEMFAAAIVNVIGGMSASAPLFIVMKKGVTAILQAGILAIALRCGIVLIGLMLIGMEAWGLSRMPLVYWVMGFYFPMLIAETAVVAWLANKSKL